MSRISLSTFTLALPAALLGQSALADVTTAEVWGDWKQYLQTMGYEISATESTNGDDLQVDNIIMSMEIPDTPGGATISFGSVTFVQNGGAVDVILPDSMPMTMTVEPGPGEPPVDLKMTFAQSGHAMSVSGSPEEMVSTYSADTAGITVDEITVDGETMPSDMISIGMNLNGFTNTTTMKVGDVRDYQQSGGVTSMTYNINVNNPAEQVKFDMAGNLDGLSFDGGGLIPTTGIDMTDMAAMLKSGFAVSGVFKYTGGSMQLQGSDPIDGDFAANTSTTGGSLGVKMNADELAYSGALNGLTASATVPDLPFPIDLSMAEYGFNLAMPISKSDTPEDFAFGFTLADFTMSDIIWSIFDPAGQLPRDPATISVDLIGKAKMLMDLMDPAFAEAVAPPAEIHALTIDKLLVSAVGAKIEGSGDITFDNSDLTTLPGVPKPVGAIDVSVNGANGLMDKLVGMGLLPEEQAMGARMMMGLFAVAGSEPDSLTSKVEFTEEGQILANGQRLR